MAQQKKFGTFSGVFTPSILTILGVIMYMRLPWIVGQAGLYMTIGIILVAHVISVTTGMSVASIATDKRVKAGGTYYMISRSLGLPIGGTLGLALFVGLSFSVSLYLIGFSESLLSFLGYEVTKQMIRLTGTAALALVTLITFISTSLAIKTQFFIMAAIILSLGSVALGHHTFMPAEPLLEPIRGSAPFIVLFGIFFPAVTGFEAGVSMSGDLEDPKRSIPLGTISAIVVGLVVYIGLAVFFAFTVQSEQLVNNTKVLMNISLSPQVVAIGIWGATLSSALGSILGAPRILQATSLDRITFRFFGKGYGKENEPRHALLMTFLIAEAGILVGELDVIARIVSMFFITTYGFLNLSCAAESWVSPDFRPEFKIPRTLSIIGAITCFVVMIELDILAMVGAVMILFGIFFYLKRKELTLESGDTWEGIWSTMIRAGLQRLNRKVTHQRNWRPNIVLFSGGTSARPHLIEMGKWMVDKRGILSNFDLVENPGLQKVLYRKSEQAVKEDTDESSGIFTRRIECIDKYECMEVISKYYGFSGIEPNTILMGWGHQTQNPEKFLKVLKNVIELDYNLMLLNFDITRGFGNHQQIDVWWRGAGNNIALAIALVRYLTASAEWHDTSVRFLTVTQESASTETLLDNMNRILAEYRVEAEVRIINNAVEKKPFHEIIQKESAKADLIINGMPVIRMENAADYIRTTSELMENLGVTLLIHASSFFDEISIVDDISRPALKEISPESETPQTWMYLNTENVPLELKPYLMQFFNRIREINGILETSCLQAISGRNQMFLTSIQERLHTSINALEKKITENERQKNHRLILKTQSDILFQIQKIVGDFTHENAEALQKVLSDRITWLCVHMPEVMKETPKTVKTVCTRQALSSVQSSRISFRIYRAYKKAMSVLTRKQIPYTVRFRMLAENHAGNICVQAYKETLRQFAVSGYLMIQEINSLIDAMMDALGVVEKSQLADDGDVFQEVFASEKKKLFDRIGNITTQCRQDLQKTTAQMTGETMKFMHSLANDLKRPDINYIDKVRKQRRVKWKTLFIKEFSHIAGVWTDNLQHSLNHTALDLTLLSFKNRLRTLSHRIEGDLQLSLQNTCTEKFKAAEQHLAAYLETMNMNHPDKLKLTLTFKEDIDVNAVFESLKNDIHDAIENLPGDWEVISLQAVKQITERPFQPVGSRMLSLHRLLEFVVETELITPMRDQVAEIAGGIQKGSEIGQDVVRLISLNQDDALSEDTAVGRESVENLRSIFNIAAARITEGRVMFETLQKNLKNNFNQFLNNAFQRLNLFSITEADKTLPLYFREQQSKKVMSHFERSVLYIRNNVSAYRTGRLYRSRTRSIEAKESKPAHQDLSPVEAVLNLVETVSPEPGTLNTLPFYYRHLFLGKPPITKEFWLGRKEALQSAGKAVSRYYAGAGGALMIVGEHGAGKTALCRFIATEHFDGRNIFYINPPNEGSIDISMFRNRLNVALQAKGDYGDILSGLPKHSVLVFNEIELWWERSDHGFDVIDLMQNLISRFGDRCFFILNANHHAFRLANRMKRTEDYFLDVISCSPMDAQTLRDIVLLRHHAAGMKFSYAERSQEALSELKLAKLFVHLHQESGGNVGVMLQNWIRSIRKVNKEMLIMDTLPKPDTTVFAHMADLHLVLAGQILIHKRLSRERIARIMQIPPDDAVQNIHALRRYGLIIESSRNVYELNPFVRPYITPFLRQKGIL